jgi:hypothetical protein
VDEPASKKTKADVNDEEADGEVPDDEEDEAEDDEEDEAEGEEDEPAVKTKVVTGSEPKAAAAEADDEAYEKED